MGVDVLGWIQSVTPPDFDLPRKENPRKKQSDTNQTYSVSKHVLFYVLNKCH